MAFINYAGETEEERRRRLEQEAAAAVMADEAVASGGAAPGQQGFGDYLGAYVDKRLGAAQDRIAQAGEYFTDPAAAFERRLGMQQEAANTEVETQTVKTYGDGSQERIVKTQMPAPVTGPAVPAPEAAMPQVQVPAPQAQMPATAPVVPGAEQRPQLHPVFAQAVQQGQARPAPPVAPIAPEAAQQPVQMPALPEPGPGVQVASTDAAAGLQAAAAARAQQQQQQVAAQAPAPTPSLQQLAAGTPPAPWVQAANDAGTDFLKLAEVAGKYPESRQFIVDKLQTAFRSKSLEDEANKLMAAAQSGDLKAWNKIQQAIKPETGRAKEEVTVNDYIKAYMFKRLGLDELARDVQKKIIGKETTFNQVTLGGSNWSTETDSSGNIVRARDDEGNMATEATLNRLRAGAQKFGGQIFGFTGEASVIPPGQPDAGQEYRQRTNAVTGQIENVITSGPNANKIYSGPPGPARSVGTSFSKALNSAFVDFQAKPTEAMAKTMLEIAGKVDSGDGKTIAATMSRIQQLTPQIFNQITSGAAGTPPAPVSGAVGTAGGAVRPGAPAPGKATAPVAPGAVPTGGGGSLLAQQAQIPASIETAETVKRAELKVPAEERGKVAAREVAKQGFADSTYPLLSAVRQEISRSTGSAVGAGVDEMARMIGATTKGQEAIAKLNVLAGPIKMNIPRFEGAQSDRDVQEYARQAGDFANPKLTVRERLAALDAMETLLKKYDKAGNNDWTFGRGESTTGGGTTSSGNKFKRVQ